jgi:3-phytase
MLKRSLLFAGLGTAVAGLVAAGFWWWSAQSTRSAVVLPVAQTTPVETAEDAADDPAVWVHPADADRSVVLGTDKKRGLAAYDLSGQLLQFLPLGSVNNVDLRSSIRWAGREIDLAVASNRDTNAIDLVVIGADGVMSKLGSIPVTLPDVYGICMAKGASGEAEIFINSKTGRTQQWSLRAERGEPVGTLINEFVLASQVEGCVVDDARRLLFVGEEAVGIWRFDLNAPKEPAVKLMAIGAGLVVDVEGLGLVHRSEGSPLLLASSQGDHHFVLMETDPPFRSLGRFRVGEDSSKGIDAVHETDGLEVLSVSLGTQFPRGLLVVQDGSPAAPGGTQNFKLVHWGDVERALGLESGKR